MGFESLAWATGDFLKQKIFDLKHYSVLKRNLIKQLVDETLVIRWEVEAVAERKMGPPNGGKP